MSYNGSGTFLINTAGQPVVTGTVISSTTFNTLTADLGTGLSTAITKDGQTTTTSRIPFIAGISSTLTTDSTSVGTGSIITSGGVGIAKALFVGTTANIAGAVTLGGAVAITSASANALAVGLNGATNPALNVDASTALSATGLNVKSAAAAGGVALSVTSSGSNEALTLNAKGTGTIGIGSVSTGAVTITPALDVTGVASFAAGTAALPSITRTGDLDTGVYFPAANTLGFSTSGSERARLDSGGILGIGVTPGAWGGVSANAAIQIKGASFFGRTDNSDAFVGTNFYRDSSNVYTYISTAAAAFLQLSGNAFNFSQAASGTAGNPITFTQRMTLDASGNLGVGTTSPISTSISSGSVTANGVLAAKNYLAAHQTSAAIIQYNTNVSTIRSYGATAGSGVLSFNVGGGGGSDDFEAARIDSSGRFLVNTTGILNGSNATLSALAQNTSSVAINAAGPNSFTSVVINAQSVTTAGTGWYSFAGQSGNGTSVTTNNILIFGNGNVTNVNNSYGAISDIKLKENIVDATPKLDKLMQVRIRNYNLKGEYQQHKQIGVVAQELETIFPAMIEESPDKDLQGNNLGTTTKSVKYSVFVPMLIKAMQEQQALIQSLTTRLTALEAK